MATDGPKRVSWETLRAASVEALATARYGPPDSAKSTQKTAVWKTTEHGALLLHRQGNFFRFDPDNPHGLRGAGALDWLIKVEGLTPQEAVARLRTGAIVPAAPSVPPAAPPRAYTPPQRWDRAWPAVRRYLTQDRALPADLVARAHAAGRLYATSYGRVPYAVFPLVTCEGRDVGALLRCAGTPAQQHAQTAAGYAIKRAAAGSDVTRGFWTLGRGSHTSTVLLVEAPIDALALAAMIRARWGAAALDRITIRATGGHVLTPEFHAAGAHRVMAAFDADAAGAAQAARVAAWAAAQGMRYDRLLPPAGAKDWADAWAAMVGRHGAREGRDKADHADTEIEP